MSTLHVAAAALIISSSLLATGCSSGSKDSASTTAPAPATHTTTTAPQPAPAGQMLWSADTGNKVATAWLAAVNTHNRAQLSAFQLSNDADLTTKLLDATKGKTYTLKRGTYATGESPQQGVMNMTLNDGKKDTAIRAVAYPNEQKQRWGVRVLEAEIAKLK